MLRLQAWRGEGGDCRRNSVGYETYLWARECLTQLEIRVAWPGNSEIGSRGWGMGVNQCGPPFAREE